MGIKEILAKLSKKDDQLKQMVKEERLKLRVQERLKNSNERELERFKEEERQKFIKAQLDRYRKQRTQETWRGKNILEQKNIFVGHQSVLKDNPNLFSIKNEIKQKGMFFK